MNYLEWYLLHVCYETIYSEIAVRKHVPFQEIILENFGTSRREQQRPTEQLKNELSISRTGCRVIIFFHKQVNNPSNEENCFSSDDFSFFVSNSYQGILTKILGRSVERYKLQQELASGGLLKTSKEISAG